MTNSDRYSNSWLAEVNCVIGGPTGCGDFDHAHVIEGELVDGKIRIGPDDCEFRIADAIGTGDVESLELFEKDIVSVFR